MAADEDRLPDSCDGATESELDEGNEYGARVAKKMQDPRKPSHAEVDEHMKTHLPYRGWCRHCVRGRGAAVTTPSRDPGTNIIRGAL